MALEKIEVLAWLGGWEESNFRKRKSAQNTHTWPAGKGISYNKADKWDHLSEHTVWECVGMREKLSVRFALKTLTTNSRV